MSPQSMIYSDSLKVTVTLGSYEMSNNGDKLYIFNIWERGLVVKKLPDSSYSTIDVDNRYNTLVDFGLNVTSIVDDVMYSLLISAGREIITMITPPYNKHSIPLDSLEKVKIGDDSLYMYSKGTRQYVQNIGLFYDPDRFDTVIKLLSFNNENYNSNILSPEKKSFSSSCLKKYRVKKRIVIDGGISGINNKIFSPQGRIVSGKNTGNSLIIIKP